LSETPERIASPPPALPGSSILFGPGGLRPGWAFLIFACLVYLLMMLCGAFVAPYLHIDHNQPIAPSSAYLLELSQFVPVLVATAMMALFERRPLLFYGYQGRARALRFLSGCFWGFIAISVAVLLLSKMGYLVLNGRVLGGASALRYGVQWGGLFLLVGFTEESMFRGYAQFTLTRGRGFWWSAILLAIPFGLLHSTNGGESLVGLLAVGAVSLVFCLSLWYTGSLWWAVGFHAAWDWGQSFFYGTADSGLVAQGHLFAEHARGPALWSGGATGPEGSIVVVPLLLVIAGLMILWWGRPAHHARGEQPFRRMAWRPGALPPS